MKRFSLAGSVCVGLLVSACGGSFTSTPVSPPPATAPIIAQPAPTSIELLRADLDAFRSRSGLPGLSVVVVDGERIEAVTSGVRRADKPAPVLAGDGFHIGSLTKSITASLIARLVEAGKLRYDATLAELFPAAVAGGLKLDLANYGIYLREQLRGLRGQSSWLRQSSFALAHTAVDAAGFGWWIRAHPTLGKVSVHDGSIGTYYAMTILLPQRDRAVAIACNCNSDAAVDQIETYLVALAARAATAQ